MGTVFEARRGAGEKIAKIALRDSRGVYGGIGDDENLSMSTSGKEEY